MCAAWGVRPYSQVWAGVRIDLKLETREFIHTSSVYDRAGATTVRLCPYALVLAFSAQLVLITFTTLLSGRKRQGPHMVTGNMSKRMK